MKKEAEREPRFLFFCLLRYEDKESTETPCKEYFWRYSSNKEFAAEGEWSPRKYLLFNRCKEL